MKKNVFSFCAGVKNDLDMRTPKKRCCQRISSYANEYFGGSKENLEFVDKMFGGCKCDSCRVELLKSAFLHFGTVTDPQKEYHLEFVVKSNEKFEVIEKLLLDAGFNPRKSVRRDLYVLYFKESSVIEDILAYIGANKAAFDVMNSKIVKELRNNANRLVNCDTANIEKSLNASLKYIEAIDFLQKDGRFYNLPIQLQETALLRIKYPQASLSELGERCEPPVSKSGIKHRLEKIYKAAYDIK